MVKLEELKIDEPKSGGIFLSYRCSGSCRHCMYACSPEWSKDWIEAEKTEGVMDYLSEKIQAPRMGPKSVGLNFGLHYTGGEPFLNYDLLLELVRMGDRFGIPGTFVETNCFWCGERKTAVERFSELKEAGLDGVLVSVNPFTAEHVPLENTLAAVEAGKEVFGSNLLIYQESFLDRMRMKDVEGTVPLEKSLELIGSSMFKTMEMLPRGRFPYELREFYPTYPAEKFFDQRCKEELKRGWHFHVDNYFNYLPAYCGGISLGDARNLESMETGISLEDKPVLKALTESLGDLFQLGTEFGYEEKSEGYISKCHLCLDIRRHLVESPDGFEELNPKEFYSRI